MDEPNISRLEMREARFEGEARLSEVSRGSRCLFRAVFQSKFIENEALAPRSTRASVESGQFRTNG